MPDLIKSSTLQFILLNPFLLVVYMIDVFAKLTPEDVRNVVFRAGFISSIVFAAVTLLGDVLIRDIPQAQFASFVVFGGIVFLLIALRFVFDGNAGGIADLRGESQHLAVAIAHPNSINSYSRKSTNAETSQNPVSSNSRDNTQPG